MPISGNGLTKYEDSYLEDVMERKLVEKIVTGMLLIFLLGCSTTAPVVQDNRADEQRANADKAHKELSQEVSKTK